MPPPTAVLRCEFRGVFARVKPQMAAILLKTIEGKIGRYRQVGVAAAAARLPPCGRRPCDRRRGNRRGTVDGRKSESGTAGWGRRRRHAATAV